MLGRHVAVDRSRRHHQQVPGSIHDHWEYRRRITNSIKSTTFADFPMSSNVASAGNELPSIAASTRQHRRLGMKAAPARSSAAAELPGVVDAIFLTGVTVATRPARQAQRRRRIKPTLLFESGRHGLARASNRRAPTAQT
jgi:hypothetical protein